MNITSPRPGATVDTAKTPEIAIAGAFRGGLAGLVRRVELYADDQSIGAAEITRRPNRDGSRTWSMTTSAPAGRHTLLACVRTWGDTTAVATVTFTVKAPPAAATVLSPDVVKPSAQVLKSISRVAGDSLTFTRAPGLETGDVVVAGISPTTPQGLLRRVTDVRRKGSATVVGTVPAALDEAFLQADINLTDVPLTPGEAAAAPTTPGAARLRKAIEIPALDKSFKLAADRTTSGANGSGTLSFDGEVHAKVYATLDVTVRISVEVKWGQLPKGKLQSMRWAVSDTVEVGASAKFSAAGELSYVKHDVIRPIQMGVIFLPGGIPVVPSIGLDAGLRAKIGGSLTWSANATANATAGFEYRDGRVFDIGTASATATIVSPLNGGAEASGSASVYIEPRIGAAVFGLAGPTIRPEAGLSGTFTAPCPGRITFGPYLTARVSADLSLFGKTLAKQQATVANVQSNTIDRPFFGCGPDGLAVSSDPLADATVGAPYSAQLEATGGTGPYTWAATGALPPGLTVVGDALSGTPTAAGTFDVPVRVTDAESRTATGTIRLTVREGVAFQITTARLNDGFVGIDYAMGMSATAGAEPYRWSATGLPGGLTMGEDGRITGKPTGEGTATVAVVVEDTEGRTASRTFPLKVNAELPPPVAIGDVDAPPAPFCGSLCTVSWGDPHLRTFDGVSYDFQRVGEFTAVKSTVDELEIQVRQRPWNGSRVVSVNSAVAVRTGGHRIGVYLTASGVRTLVDGTAVDLAAGTAQLSGGGTVSLDANARRVTVSGADGTYLAVDYDPGSALNLTAGAPESQRGSLRGLLGEVGDDPEVWRVTPETSLFDYEAGEDTSTFTDFAFPYADLPLNSVPGANRDAARAACAAAGITDQKLLDACALDVALSGDQQAAAAAIVAQSAGEIGDGAVLGASKAGSAWKDPAGATGVSELTHGHNGCTALDARNLCTAGTYARVPDAPWIWTRRLLTPGQNQATFTATVTVSAAQAAKPARLYAAGDDVVTAGLNGATVLTAGFTEAGSAAVQLRPGVNTLTFEVVNEGSSQDPIANPAALAWKLVAGQ
ncbi:putative Ig domain-containing protein [Actinoplanes sp. NBRC 103695]|uniref:putative Ig domain-containing protein n=1 Tax=Actinoplanes sp. NBRC 103695 TaxID=3032202 RepID=UPI0025570162|nr:putative Ig domain-containing protein [Actinoplanes sp. NBRC 103695]